MPLAIRSELSYEPVVCCACGIHFAIDSIRWANLKEKKEGFHCPNGHPLTYGDGEVDKLKKQLASEQQRRSMAEQTAQAEAKRAQRAENTLKRERERAGNGVCPCCDRSFVNLQRHMKTKHPDHANNEKT